MISPEAMHRLHAHAFAGQGRAWSAEEISKLLQSPYIFATGGPHGFALTRVVADEAELLTLATDPAWQRQGLARRCLAKVETEATARAALGLFLEVAADNRPAIMLYRAAGYGETGRRTAYYHRPDGSRADALVLHKGLGAAKRYGS